MQKTALPVETRRPVQEEKEPDDKEFKVNPWACMTLLVITVGVMAATAEFVCHCQLCFFRSMISFDGHLFQ